MFSFFSQPPTAKSPTARKVTPQPFAAPHRQGFSTEVAYYHTAAEIADCMAVPTPGRRVVLYGGQGVLPAALQDRTDPVIRTAADPLAAAVVAFAGLTTGDTLTVLLPHDWSGPPAEALIDHARRWFASPHSSEDEAVG